MPRGIICIVFTVGMLFSLIIQGVSGQGIIQIVNNEVVVEYPLIVRFGIDVRSSAEIESITLLYRTNAMSCRGGEAQQEVNFEPGKQINLEWEWELKRAGTLPPGAAVSWQWEIHDTAGNSLLTAEQTIAIQDERHEWQQIQTTDGSALIQWYLGDRQFGEQLARITRNSLRRLSGEIGVTTARQVSITIYPTPEELQEVLIIAHEWVGGVAIPEYGSVIIGAQPDEIAWLEDVIPHELAHLLVEELIFNCKGIRLPTWLSEGLAVFSEGALSRDQHNLIETALEEGRLRPFRALERGFSVDSEKADLEYIQSGALVEFMLAEYGPEQIAVLLEAMQGGLLIDPALQQVYGLDSDGLDSAWRVSLGYKPLATAKPTTSLQDTPIPTLVLYTSVVQVPDTDTPLPPTASNTARPPTATQRAAETPSTEMSTNTPAATSRSVFPGCGSSMYMISLVITGLVLRRRRK